MKFLNQRFHEQKSLMAIFKNDLSADILVEWLKNLSSMVDRFWERNVSQEIGTLKFHPGIMTKREEREREN